MAVESVLTFAAEGILTKLTSLAAHEISLAWGFKAELNRLRETLSTIEGYLADVPQKPQDQGGSLKKWVTNLTRLAQDADDVLDEFNYELLRRKVEIRNHMKKKVLNFFSLSNPVAFRLKIAHKIQKINASLEKLKSEAPIIGLVVSNKINAAPQGIRGRIQTDSLLEKDEIIIGRKNAVSEIVTTLTSSDMNQENLSVMAIAGMPGLGKTTLAKSVYNDNSVTGYFEKRIWVCVSDPFNINVILICMLESLNPSKATVRENQDAMLKYIEEELREKRYLLVLDDVWNEESEKWERLMSHLSKLNSAPGSKIIVTTRSDKVASITETLPRPKLNLLSTDECWSILKRAACSDGRNCEGLETIGREIAKNCEGLPLTAQVLGGILRSKKTSAEWSEVKDNRIWDLPKTEDRIMSVLKLSFDNLESPALKQCFSYCSAIKKDAVMERDDLIQLWMAQGFLHPSEKSNLEMEDIGNEYFDILFQRSLFQDARLDDDGIVIGCKMHDLIHDLAERVSKTGSMMRDFHKDEDVATPIIERIPEGSSGKLRSLFSNAEALPGNMLPWFKALRVLKLYGAYIIQELPSSIEELKRLRYFDISFTKIKRLPNSIGKLYNLQTLRARYCGLEEFPKDVQNLINLRHVYCNKETKFPAGVLGRLTSLRKLSYSFEDYKVMGREIVELAALNQLKGKLIICNLEDVRNGDEASKAKLEEKKKVRHFIFEWTKNRSTTNNNEEDVLEGLQPHSENNNDDDVLEGLQPHSELERLEIKYFMGTKFPSWMIKLRNLKQIELQGCNRCEKVPTLGHLPHLTVVWIEGMDNLKCVGEEIYGNGVFPALKELHIHNCKELIEWMEAPEQVMVFPRLEKLEIEDCPKLRKAHYIFGCRASLRKLAVYGCSSLQSIPDLHSFTSLCELTIECCERLESLVSSGPVSVVELLTIEGCSGLQSIPDLNLFPSLRVLSIESCEKLESLVSSGPVSLVELEIRNAPNLESLPSLDNLTSLCVLVIVNCGKLKYLPTGLHCCASLNTLVLGAFWEELDSFPYFHLETGSSQRRLLRLTGWPKLKSLPQQIQDFTSLAILFIRKFDGVEALEDWLGNLTSLWRLEICSCKKLMYLPSVEAMQRLTKLQTLIIWECPLLKERCTKDSGPEWPKISHIPDIRVWCPDSRQIDSMRTMNS